MKITFLNKPRGLGIIRIACLLILITALLANSLSAFAALNCVPSKNKPAKPKKPTSTAVASPAASPKASPAASPTATSTSKTFRLNSVAVILGSKVTQMQALIDHNQPVYYLVNDTDPKNPMCSSKANKDSKMACTQEWQPLLLLPNEALTVDGLPCKLTVTENVNGQQITCNNHPLYINVKDLALIARGVDNHWLLVTSTAPLAEGSSLV